MILNERWATSALRGLYRAPWRFNRRGGWCGRGTTAWDSLYEKTHTHAHTLLNTHTNCHGDSLVCQRHSAHKMPRRSVTTHPSHTVVARRCHSLGGCHGETAFPFPSQSGRVFRVSFLEAEAVGGGWPAFRHLFTVD